MCTASSGESLDFAQRLSVPASSHPGLRFDSLSKFMIMSQTGNGDSYHLCFTDRGWPCPRFQSRAGQGTEPNLHVYGAPPPAVGLTTSDPWKE